MGGFKCIYSYTTCLAGFLYSGLQIDPDLLSSHETDPLKALLAEGYLLKEDKKIKKKFNYESTIGKFPDSF
jgi:hypothetical protein